MLNVKGNYMHGSRAEMTSQHLMAVAAPPVNKSDLQDIKI